MSVHPAASGSQPLAQPQPIDAHATDAVPLCVDLDGSLTPVDTLHESLFDMLRRRPISLLSMTFWITSGKSRFKEQVAKASDYDVTLLPMRGDLLSWLQQERAGGRRLVLATATNEEPAARIAAHLGIFDEVIASSATENRAGEHKRRALVERFGEKGFDYIGNSAADLPVWKSARRAIVVGGQRLEARARRVADVDRVFPVQRPPLGAWLRAIRVHQWVKNILVFVPAAAAHRLTDSHVLLMSVLGFLAFSLCASSVYVVNDLLDLASDRTHPRKRERPFASGLLSTGQGLLLAALLLLSSASIAAWVGPWFSASLLGYYLVTWLYSLRLKRAALVDVMTLAGLYTLRIIAGASAALIVPSFWLLAFSMFVFLCLGIVKRYAELHDMRQSGQLHGHGRGYSSADLELLMSMGLASGFCSVVVVALYINSPQFQDLYRREELMWLTCPLLLYWVMRIWLVTARGKMSDDPVVFALRDRTSIATLGLVGFFVLASI